MEIIKAEFLWSRRCRLNCEYCGMVTGQKNNYLTEEEWCIGIDNLKQLGCGFIAFYGAEPLLEFDLLPEVIRHAEEIGIHTTVITSGEVPLFLDKLMTLRTAGLKSLSMSYDIVPLGEGSQKKMEHTVEHLIRFKKLSDVRDVAAIATVTSKNYYLLPKMVEEMSRIGIWTLFDIIHPDRGQPGSKCRNFPGIKDLLFEKADLPFLTQMFEKLKEQKKQGLLIHTSNVFLDMIIEDPALVINYDWNCGCEEDFPAFVTVDVTGRVYPCDDFNYDTSHNKVQIFDLVKKWDSFKKVWKHCARNKCPGCVWNTHIDAYAIKRGDVPFSDYVHTTKVN